MRILTQFLVIGFLTVLMVGQAMAGVSVYEEKLKTRPMSPIEDVGVAFLKLTGNFPDFKKVVEGMDGYKQIDPLAQPDFKEKLAAKFQKAYLSYTPLKSDVIIRSGVTVLFNRSSPDTGTIEIRNFSSSPIFFPYEFAGYPIALIAQNLELFHVINLSPEELEKAYTRLSLDGGATLLLQLFPIAADDKKTMMLGDVPQYPLLADIGYIGLLNWKGEEIWYWTNPKYNGTSTLLPGVGSAQILNLKQ